MASKKKAVKKKKKKAPASSTKRQLAPSPEGMEEIWDEECQEVWTIMKVEHRTFFLEWLTNGYNGLEAVTAVYGYGEDDRSIAYVQASRLLNGVKILKLRSKLAQSTTWELQTARQVFVDAMKSGSHGERISGAKAHIDMLDRLGGKTPGKEPAVVNNIQNNVLVIVEEKLDS